MITRQPAPTPVSESLPIPPEYPALPDDVLKRFPSLVDWQENEIGMWSTKMVQALSQQNRTVSKNISENKTDTRNLRVSFGTFTAEITEEIDAIVNEQGAQARRIVTVSAMAGINSRISVQGTAPVGPSSGDYWINNADPTLPITYIWSGTSWDEVTTPISYAGVAQEQTARVTADGFLSGKYSLTVIAGNVVTGMNITSSTGTGANISSVIFRASDFQIYDGASGKVMFVADAVQNKVRMAGTFTVDGATSSIYIKTTAGAGSYASAGTPFFVDSLGRMSLGAGLAFDGVNLSIAGSVTASSGTIGGWTINTSTLSRNNAILDSAGQLVLGTSNDIVYLSATDATYRMWVGNVSAGAAAFAVSKTGLLFATGATIAGDVTALTGLIGGFTITTSQLTSTQILIRNGSTPRLEVGSSGTYTSTGTQQIRAFTSSVNVATLGSNDTVSDGFLYLSNVGVSWYFTLKPSGADAATFSGDLTATRIFNQYIGMNDNIFKRTADTWTPKLYTGDLSTAGDSIEFQAVADQIFGRINGGAAILLG